MGCEPILIVDDNPMNLKLVRVLLETEGYDVRTAADAEEALAALEAFRPRLILMDLQLPGMDGLTLTRRLKADAGRGRGTHFVAWVLPEILTTRSRELFLIAIILLGTLTTLGTATAGAPVTVWAVAAFP